jgi:hypothetical protein
MRVLTTGSRTWEGIHAENRIQLILNSLHAFAEGLGTKLTIIHGDCPSGADAIVDRWAVRREADGVTVVRYPAKWQLYGKAAGPVRNKIMVKNAQADFCIGFSRGGSLGTAHTLELARQAGIPTFVVPWEEEIP